MDPKRDEGPKAAISMRAIAWWMKVRIWLHAYVGAGCRQCRCVIEKQGYACFMCKAGAPLGERLLHTRLRLAMRKARQLPAPRGLAVLAIAGALLAPAAARAEVCSYHGHWLGGRVQFVDAHPDVRIRIVDSEEAQLRVVLVDAFANRCGRWQIVDAHSTLRVQVVDAHEDVRVQIVGGEGLLPSSWGDEGDDDGDDQ